jgi:hypothetical protein
MEVAVGEPAGLAQGPHRVGSVADRVEVAACRGLREGFGDQECAAGVVFDEQDVGCYASLAMNTRRQPF